MDTSRTKWADWLGIETLGDSKLEALVDSCAKWASALRDNQSPRWLTLLGSSGTGKTHCAKRLFRWAAGRFSCGTTLYKNRIGFYCGTAYEPRTVYWPDFVQQLRAGNAFSERDDMKKWPVLFLDDIGSERDPSGFASEELHTLLGCRMGKWTIITANMTLDRVEAIDARIASRMLRDKNILVTVETEDYSLRKAELKQRLGVVV